METLVTRLEARAEEANHRERGVQVDDMPVDESSTTTKKRKRVDDLCTLGASGLCVPEGESIFASRCQLRRPFQEESFRSFYEPFEELEVRPAKRARAGTKKAVMTVAAAAGYTSLGAALAWFALAYAL